MTRWQPRGTRLLHLQQWRHLDARCSGAGEPIPYDVDDEPRGDADGLRADAGGQLVAADEQPVAADERLAAVRLDE